MKVEVQMSSENKKQERPGKALISSYVPADEVAAIDAFARSMEARNPGLRMTRTDALRILYKAGLKASGVEVAS